MRLLLRTLPLALVQKSQHHGFLEEPALQVIELEQPVRPGEPKVMNPPGYP